MTPEDIEQDKLRWFEAWKIVNKLTSLYDRQQRLAEIEHDQGNAERTIIEERVKQMWEKRHKNTSA